MRTEYTPEERELIELLVKQNKTKDEIDKMSLLPDDNLENFSVKKSVN